MPRSLQNICEGRYATFFDDSPSRKKPLEGHGFNNIAILFQLVSQPRKHPGETTLLTAQDLQKTAF